MWTGWIMLPKGDRGGHIVIKAQLFLKHKLSDNAAFEEYRVEVDDLDLLDPFWGEAIWGLGEVK